MGGGGADFISFIQQNVKITLRFLIHKLTQFNREIKFTC